MNGLDFCQEPRSLTFDLFLRLYRHFFEKGLFWDTGLQMDGWTEGLAEPTLLDTSACAGVQ